MNAEDFFNQGLAKAHKGDIKAAIVDFTEAIQLYPKFAAAHLHRLTLGVQTRSINSSTQQN